MQRMLEGKAPALMFTEVGTENVENVQSCQG